MKKKPDQTPQAQYMRNLRARLRKDYSRHACYVPLIDGEKDQDAIDKLKAFTEKLKGHIGT